MKILFVGPQGAGKSTQGKVLADFLKVPYISTGDIFRELSTQDNELANRVKSIMSAGNLVDDQTTSEIVKERLQKPDLKNGFIFDGYPRTLKQVEYFDPGFDKVVYLKVDDSESKRRLLERGREDDTDELIEQRLKVYHQLTDPILDYYQSQGNLITIDATQNIDEISLKLKEILNGEDKD